MSKVIIVAPVIDFAGAKANDSFGIPSGDHVITTGKAKLAVAKTGTEQISVPIEDEQGNKMLWFVNFCGFERFDSITDAHLAGVNPVDLNIKPAQWKGMSFEAKRDAAFTREAGDEGYAVNVVTNQRVFSAEKTRNAQGKIKKHLMDAGMTEEAVNGIKSVEGIIAAFTEIEVGVNIAPNSQGNMRVNYTMAPDKVAAL